MSRETIRRAVVQKFNETKGWTCQSLDEVYDHIEDRAEANRIINSLKICDPAVGSGHFLVSALNEIIAVKHDLRVLQDRQGKRLKEYDVEVANDELVITDIETGDQEVVVSATDAFSIGQPAMIGFVLLVPNASTDAANLWRFTLTADGLIPNGTLEVDAAFPPRAVHAY